MRGLVVGRFQPFHNGHLGLVRAAIEDCVTVVVGIGSSNAKQSLRNPFSFDERKRMVEAAFADEVKAGTVSVIALPDIHDPPNWVDHVLKLTGPIDKAFGNDAKDMALFEDAGVPVGKPGLVARETLEASTVRMQLAEDDPAWRKAVPGAVVALLEAFDAGKRLRLLEANA